MDAARLVLEGVSVESDDVTMTVTSAAVDAFTAYGTDAAATVTASAALYVARKARSISRKLDRYDTILFGDDRIEGRDGIANIALENERRSLENRDAIRDHHGRPGRVGRENLEPNSADD